MNTKRKISTLWISTILILVSCQTTNQPEHHAFFEKMIGEWKLKDKPVIEKWRYVDGQFLASVFVISGADKKITEEIRIVENADGVFYEANVEDQNKGEPVLFKMILSDENKIIFENKEHDFPQRITYELIDKNHLIAIIEGILDGVLKSIDFNYYRKEEVTK